MENTIEVGSATPIAGQTFYDIIVNGQKVGTVMHDTEEGYVDIVRTAVRGGNDETGVNTTLLSLPVNIPCLRPDIEPPLGPSW